MTPTQENPWVADRHDARGVATVMLARVRTLLAVTALVAVAACGGKDKGKKTTPGGATGGGSDATGMNDKDPEGGGGDAGGNPDLPGGGGGDGGGEAGGGDAGDGDTGGGDGDGTKEPDPKYAPPNLDPDPEQARSSVQAHLRTGRDALRGDRPDPDLAIKEAKAALVIDGTSIDAVVILAHAYYHKRLYDTAETVLDMLMKDRQGAKNNAGVFYVYGLVYDKTNEPKKAELAYKTAVDLKPDYASALVNLGVHQLANKQYEDAVVTYEKLTGQLDVTGASVWNALGSAYRGRSGDYDPGSSPQADWLLKAETAFKRSTSADRNYGPAYYNLGLLYLDADPFPTSDGGSLDNLVRLQKAKTYFEEYKNMPGVDMKLFDARMKDVTKLIKREEKKRKKKTE